MIRLPPKSDPQELADSTDSHQEIIVISEDDDLSDLQTDNIIPFGAETEVVINPEPTDYNNSVVE